jgi:hypothetical protein
LTAGFAAPFRAAGLTAPRFVLLPVFALAMRTIP